MQQLWDVEKPLSKAEELICKRLKRNGKLFVFLRKYRHLIFDKQMCEVLETMYHDYPRGKPMIAPSLLAMATVLQAYEQKSDADTVLESVFDKRWQMVLDCLGEEEPPFAQGTLCDFRHRLIRHNVDKQLNAKVVEIAKAYGEFSFKKLRVSLDSAPLEGAGRVEDTFNLIGHALELLVGTAAFISGKPAAMIREETGTEIIGKSSIKAAMDIDWADQTQKGDALNILLKDVNKVVDWIDKQASVLTDNIGIIEDLVLLKRLIEQDIEPDPNGGNKIKKGVAKERQISITDSEMRHGRKSASRTINGYKQHIVVDLDSEFILATCVRPANEPEHEAADMLKPEIEYQWGKVEELQIDRGYLAANWSVQLYEEDKHLVCKPWIVPKRDMFSKKDFKINLENQTITCPHGHDMEIKGSGKRLVRFNRWLCNHCPVKSKCTPSKIGRSIQIHEHEAMMVDLSQYTSTSLGRTTARERIKVEHALASVCNRKGPKARYIGIRKNEYDLNRVVMITNLHNLERLIA